MPTTTPHVFILIDAWFPFCGGGQVHVKHLSQALRHKYSYHIKIFHPQHHGLLHRVAWSFTVIFQLLIVSFKHKPHLIHSHGFLPGLPAKIVSLLLDIPVVHTVHGSHLMDTHASGLKACFEKFLLTKIHYTGQITVSSTFLNYPNVNSNIKVISNGVPLSDFDQIKTKKYPQPTIICVARDHPHKGLKYLHSAYQSLLTKHPHLQLKIISSGKTQGKALIKIYKRSHFFVLPSLVEGQPITLLEAWAAKLPVIITKVGDNPNMVKHRINGLLVNPADPHQLVQAINTLLTQPKLAKKLAQQGYQTAKHYYTWDIIAQQTHHYYQSLLQ